MLRSAFKQKIIVFCSIRVCTRPFAPWFFRGARCCLVLNQNPNILDADCRHSVGMCCRLVSLLKSIEMIHMWAITIIQPSCTWNRGGEKTWYIHFYVFLLLFLPSTARHYDDWISWHFNKWWIARCHTFTGKNQTFFFLASIFFSGSALDRLSNRLHCHP